MGKRSFGLTGSALALVLLSVGCGDDGDDGTPNRNDGSVGTPDATTPGPDGGTVDSGDPVVTPDAAPSADGGGGTDASRDSGPVPPGDGGGTPLQFSGACFYTPAELLARADAGVQSNAGIDELTGAVTVAGSQVAGRRAEIVMPLYCHVTTVCDPSTGPQDVCTSETVAEYNEGVAMSYDPLCLDRTLDAFACAGSVRPELRADCACLDECDDLRKLMEDACAPYAPVRP